MDKIKVVFKKYWLKFVIVLCSIIGLLLVFKTFTGNNNLKEKLRDVAEGAKDKVTEINIEKKTEDIKVIAAIQQNDTLKELMLQKLQIVQRITNREKRLNALIRFHESIKK